MNVSQTMTKAFKSRIFLTQAFTGMVFLILLFSVEGWQTNHVLFEESLFFVGVVFVAICLVGRAWSLSYIAGSKNKKLITKGPYSLCRNPLYFSNFLGAVGLGLCTETITITVAILFAFALYYPKIILREEKKLGRLFGDEFESYRRRVNAFFPSWKGFVENETMLISVRNFRNGLVDLAFLVVAIGLIDFLEILHEANILPTFLTLY